MDPTSSVAARRQHNNEQPIHTLPAELFINILILYTEDITCDVYEPDVPTAHLHVLAQVCSHWFHSILANRRFWRTITRDDSENYLTPIILHRNPNGPLVIRCKQSFAEEMNDFLSEVSDHSSRWESLSLGEDLEESTLEILERPMPALKALKIDVPWDNENDNVFPASEAPGLEYIKIANISMPWDSPSLSGLKYLSLSHIFYKVPSMHQLVAILTASPALEWFELVDLKERYEADANEGDGSDLPKTVLCPALRGLVLDRELLPSMQHYFASSIVAPRCHTLLVTIKLDSIERPGSTFAELARIPLQAPGFHMIVQYRQDGIIVQLLSEAETYRAERQEFDGDIERSEIVIEMGYDVDKWAFLVQALALLVTTSEILLSCDANPQDPQGQSLIKPEHFTCWSSANKIEFQGEYPDVLAVLGYLRSPSVVDGEERWAMPKLKDISFFERKELPMDVDIVSGILIEILEGRYLASRREGAAVPVQPLSRIQASYAICDIVKKSQYAEGIFFDPMNVT